MRELPCGGESGPAFREDAQCGLHAEGRMANEASNLTVIRAAIALRSAVQSVIWIGFEAGIFRKHGIEVNLTLDTGGPRSAAGVLRGDWEFCHTGDTPVVEGVLQGHDPVVIVGPVGPHDSTFLMARRDITKPEQLAGARI